jgi:hypothetical protein
MTKASKAVLSFSAVVNTWSTRRIGLDKGYSTGPIFDLLRRLPIVAINATTQTRS